MNRRAAIASAWALFGLYVVSVAATLWLVVDGGGSEDDTFVVLALGFAVVGVLVAIREPGNAVGWVLLVSAVWYGFANLSYAYVRVADRPGETAIAWFADWVWVPWLYGSAILLPMLFPTGRPLSPRWRRAVALVVAAAVLTIAGRAFGERALDVASPAPISNPLGLTAPLAYVVTGASFLGGVLALVGLVLGVTSLFVRMRRSRGRERQQVKVFAYLLAVLLLDAGVFVTSTVAAPSARAWVETLQGAGWLTSTLLLTVGVPGAIAVAILRHRLYGIDVVINRTLVYGSLTVILVVTYLTLVLVLQQVVLPLAGDSDLAVAASTLAVAGLFRPLRARIQAAVDRRFYRRRYDAAVTLDAFAGRLRHEVDLDAVGADLRTAVRESVQPTHVTLWLRRVER